MRFVYNKINKYREREGINNNNNNNNHRN
jgi:hypothetical protein